MLLVLPFWVSSVKYMCNIYVPLYFSIFIKNLFVFINFIRFKYKFHIKVVIGFRGTPLWSRIWIGFVVNLVTVGALSYGFLW
jgi:hypothetical protein